MIINEALKGVKSCEGEDLHVGFWCDPAQAPDQLFPPFRLWLYANSSSLLRKLGFNEKPLFGSILGNFISVSTTGSKLFDPFQRKLHCSRLPINIITKKAINESVFNYKGQISESTAALHNG